MTDPVMVKRAWTAIDRNKGQMATSTPRRDRFTFTRREMESLIAVLPMLKEVLDD
jgi:hypothetical protein